MSDRYTDRTEECEKERGVVHPEEEALADRQLLARAIEYGAAVAAYRKALMDGGYPIEPADWLADSLADRLWDRVLSRAEDMVGPIAL